MAKQLLLFANELRIRAEEIPARAATADDSQADARTRGGLGETGAADRATRSRGSRGVCGYLTSPRALAGRDGHFPVMCETARKVRR